MTQPAGRDEPGPQGRPAWYRPKEPRPQSLTLTAVALGILEATRARTGASRSDICEQLLRRFASQVQFPPPDEGAV